MIATVQGVTGRPVRISGYAQDCGVPIARILFSWDGGTTWDAFETDGATADRVVNWSFEFTPERPGRYHVLARAVRADGAESPEAACATVEVA